MTKSLTLNREQIEKLAKIASHFKEVQHFTLESDNSSGIGICIKVKFDLFEKNDTVIDVTDVKEW